MNKLDLLTIGDSSIDLRMKVEDNSVSEDLSDKEHPKMCFYHGSKIPVEKFETSIAGNSVNVAVGAHTLGLKTAVYTEIGDDENADRLKNELHSLGINSSFVIKNPGTETDVHAVVIFQGERTIFSYHGKRDYKVKTWPAPKFIYYTSIGKNFEQFQKELISYLKQNPKVGVIFNPGTYQLKAGEEHLHPFIAITDILILNKEEAEKVTGLPSDTPLRDLHTKLHSLGPKLSVITDAENGASADDGIEFVEQAAYTDERPIIDKTGAGDAFSAGFVSAIIYGKSVKDALRWGVINAGHLIKTVGVIKGLLNKEQIEERIN